MVTLVTVVAAATVIFSILEGVLLRPLPYPQGDDLFRVFHTSSERREAGDPGSRTGWNRLPVTRDALRVWSEDVATVNAIGGYVSWPGRWSDQLGTAAEVEGAWILEGFFEALGGTALIGRLPTRQEVRSGTQLVVLSEAFWASRYGRDPDILGRTVRHAWVSGTVVGVLPGTFAMPSEHTRWWSPVPPGFANGRTDVPQFSAIARLESGTGPENATQELTATLTGLASGNASYAGLGVRLAPLHDEVVGDVRSGILQLFWAVSLVVLIASVNLATVTVARASRRRGELAVRAALGASRSALVGSILTEVLLLCAVGGGLGILSATWVLDPVVSLLSASFPGFPRLDNVGVNLTVVGFTAGVTVAAATLSGLIPALVWSNRPPWEAIKGAAPGRSGQGVRRGYADLLFLESGMAVVLLVAAGLLVRSVLRSHAVDPGFDDRGTAFLEVSFSGDRAAGPVALQEAGRSLDARLASLPTVASVGRARTLPTLGSTRTNLVWTPELSQVDGAPVVSVEVSPGYFRTMGIPVIRGRTFDQADGPGAEPVAVVSERFARDVLGQADPIGRTVLFGRLTRNEGNRLVSDDSIPLRVVGVVDDVRQLSLTRDPEPVLYLPLARTPTRSQSVVLRTTGDPRDALATVRRTVEAMGLGLTVDRLGTLETAVRQPLAPLRLRTLLLVILGGLAGLLILVGIYGVVAHVVSDGVREMAIRMALGARGTGETARVVLQTLRPVLAGAALGLAGAVPASRLVEQALYGVRPLDPLTYGAVLVLMVVSAAATAWVPARRAARVDPVQVLNQE